MSGEMMNFPDTAEEFMEQYKIVDSEEVYTNGAELVPIFRMEQWFEQHPEPHWIPVTERLPKSKEEDLEYPTVLICFENEEIMLGCFYESTKEWGTGEYFDKKCDPIAWMPLPEPFEGVTT